MITIRKAQMANTPTIDGQPKRFYRNNCLGPLNLEWVNNFKEIFRRATTSVSYKIQLFMPVETTPIEPFELVNGRTKEKLTLIVTLKQNIDEFYAYVYNWLLQRCPIGETAPIKWENRENSDANFNYIRFELRYHIYSGANLNNIRFDLWGGNHCIGQLSPPSVEEGEEAD